MSNKPTLQPPVFPPDPREYHAKRKALIVFAVLAVCAAAVVLILPYWFSEPLEKNNVSREPAVVHPPAPKEEISSTSEANARQELNEALKIKARLDNQGAKIWGEELFKTSYGQAQNLLQEADSHFEARHFDLAAAGYQKAAAAFEQLAASRPQRTQLAIQTGYEALEKPDAALARRHFEIALAADIGNNKALHGLKRVEVLPQLLELLKKGQEHEAGSLLDNARSIYEDALTLDKDSQTAHDHLVRVNELIAERDFKKAMSDAMSAFNRQNIGRARREVNIAKKIKPNNEALHDLERQIEAAERTGKLQRISGQAADHEKKEQWEQALQLYIKALKIDPAAGFAQRGKLRAERFTTLDRAVKKYLANPKDLQAPEHRGHARSICETAMASGDTGEKLIGRINQLRSLIERYEKPVSILFQSDAMTDVRIYRIGRLGTFTEHTIQLRPGRYKAHGTRSGYRDVTIDFTVPLDSTAVTVMVVCKEAI